MPIDHRQLAIGNGFMSQLKIAAVLAISIVLQLSLGAVWPPLSYIDFPLIVVVFIALQRDAWQALLVGSLAGLIVDAASGGLIGAGGFSKTLTAYLIYFAATRVNLENPLLRIPVLAAATVADAGIYVFWHRLLGSPPVVPVMQTMSYKLIATTTMGTLVLYMLDAVIAERSAQRRQFATRRRVARRSTGSLRRR
ncbi:MAG: rod shape-determining protein MreD [Acidobacteria bacterium]|nr:MAG: rod shape-determining protein MreD [Acidobacteriota bacterium]